MHSMWDQLERAARHRGDALAVSCSGERFSWRLARDRAARLARVLHERGVRDGARVAFISPNSGIYMLMPFAVECAGGIFVPLNSRLSVAELQEQLRDASPVLLIAEEPFVSVGREAAALADVPVMTVGDSTDGHGLLSSALAAAPLSAVERPPQSPVAIYYTGGTTGRAKGVILTGDRLVMNALQWAHGIGARDDEHLLVVAPMFHMVAALNAIISAVLCCNLTILDRFDARMTLQTIAQDRVTNFAVVPAMIDMLLAVDGFADHDLSSLRTLTYGGSPITVKTLDAALTQFPQVRLFQVYGQTEGGPTISVLRPEWHSRDPARGGKLRSAGKPVVLTDLRIVRPDGSDCATGEAGEIAVRGPAVAPGYWNRPAENEAAYRGGWLHTGDAGYLDEDGFLFIVDRIKDMIVSGGENVYAAEVERVISQHPAVLECAVIGIPSERWGEAVHAIIRLRPDGQAGAEDIIAFCRARISAFKSPRTVDFQDEPFPLTGAGKIDKKRMRADHAQRQSREGPPQA